jgi:tetratricopeptide (TPR) repeat protein
MQTMDIIAVNNNAVYLLRQGSFHKAIPFFLSAVRELHRITWDQKQNMRNIDPIDDRSFVQEVRSVPLGDTLSYLKPSIYQDQDAFSIFDRAFLIDSSASASTYYSEEGQHYLTTVLLYNMGLAYQLLGMEDLLSQRKNLKKAMKIYQMTAAILEKSGDEANVLVFLAVSNNMGHIYSHFCETQDSQRCLDCLLEGLNKIQDSKVKIRVDEFRAFQMNVMMMHGQRTLAAAAA